MFTTREQLIKRTGKNGVGRFEFLEQLVNEFQGTNSFEAKIQVLANLANFAYDPINYEYLRQLKVIDIFLDELSKTQSPLIQFAIAGLCNLALDTENKEYIIHCNGVHIISSYLASPEEEVVVSAITTLMFLVTPESKPVITAPEIVDCMLQFLTSSSTRVRNLATVFLDDYCTEEQLKAAKKKLS
ncbi:armadillo repeat-containing protein 7 [Anabrus simplex]|uniref:armadillo repeat-containing protein 7 n=1 Tax=Anabrus simplex TaxID=316456 RepID=UPI0035A3AABB